MAGRGRLTNENPSTTQTTPTDMERKHCWECARRSLVCDSTRPACRRCTQSGTDCPGYGQKPLRLKWLAPGRVTSQNRRPKKVKAHKAEVRAEEVQGNLVVPRFQIRTNTCAIFQAVEYFNSCIHPDLLPMLDLAPNPEVYPISPAHLRSADTVPDHVSLSLVCMTLSHRIQRIRTDQGRTDLIERLYRYRGDVIRSLKDHLGDEAGPKGDVLLAGIISFLLADIQQGTSLNWRCHIDGARNLIRMRGGLRALKGANGMSALVHCFVLANVMGDTTSPASNLSISSWHPDDLDFVMQSYNIQTNPCRTCPPALFVEIIRINYLRMRAAEHKVGSRDDLRKEGFAILSRIEGFSLEQWVDSKPSVWKNDWVVLGSMHQVGVALYCILSLQSVSVLDLDTLSISCRTLGRRLQLLLTHAISSPRMKLSALWPLVVLGVEAVNGGAGMRNFVEESLREMSYFIGSIAPNNAAILLRKFWESVDSRWDACFHRPSIFLAQTAVDTSGISRV